MGKWVSELRIHGESAQEWEPGRVLQKSCFHGSQDRVLTLQPPAGGLRCQGLRQVPPIEEEKKMGTGVPLGGRLLP